MSRPKQVIEILDEKPRELPPNRLPTGADVLLAIQYVKLNKNSEWKDIEKDVALEVTKIWNTATIPINSERRIIAKVHDFNQAFLKLLNIPKSRKDKQQYIEKSTTFHVSFSPVQFGFNVINICDLCFSLMLRNCLTFAVVNVQTSKSVVASKTIKCLQWNIRFLSTSVRYAKWASDRSIWRPQIF